MNVQLLALCDAATDENGKLSMLGVFDTIMAAQVPVTHNQCAVALRLIFGKADEGMHTLRLTLADADGKPVIKPFDMPVEVALGSRTHMAARNFIVNIQRLRLSEAGLYSVDILFDGSHVSSVPFEVKLRHLEE